MKAVVKSTATHKGVALSKVRELKKLYTEMQGLFLAALEKAIRMGEILSEIKDELPYGQFTAWVESSGLPFKVRTAQLYMRLYDRQEELRLAGVENVREAQKFLSSGGNIDTEEAQRVALLEEQKSSVNAVSETKINILDADLSSIKLTAREQELVDIIAEAGGDRQSTEQGIKIQKLRAKQERERRQQEKKKLQEQQQAQAQSDSHFKQLEVPPNVYRRFARLAKKTGRPIAELLEEAADALAKNQRAK